MIDENEHHIKMCIKILKRNRSEKSIAESILKVFNVEKNLKSIGYVKDIDSKFKNDAFDEIFEDELGNIIDIRIFYKKPTSEKVDEMSQYWTALYLTFNKPVEPYFFVNE